MAADLVREAERLRFASENIDETGDDCIDARLHEARPKKRPKPTLEELKAKVEKEYLTPPTTFDTKWLNKLQQRWDVPADPRDIFAMAPTQTRTVIRFTREGLEGRVTGYKEVTVPASSATAKNSTSILRKPANRADFVRGAAGFFPFAPGGLDGVTAVAELEDQTIRDEQAPASKGSGLDRVIDLSSEDGLLQTPPGFSRGLDFSKAKTSADSQVESILASEAEKTEGQDVNGEDDAAPAVAEPSTDNDADEIDEFLPVEFSALEPRGVLAPSKAKSGREWAHVVDVKKEITNFHELVPEMARDWPFELDTFQKEAVYHLESGDSVFVAAHTSAGKTVVAEYAIALAAKHMTKAIYTSPIKALSNQKFRDFRQEFDDVGILTGDVQINAEASCLIMTTEILRSMLYRGADLLRDVEYVIFDEVHYVNDLERGVVWEEVIIMLPDHVSLILLSATVPNTYEFASWVGRTKKRDIYVISTSKRPVPLEHYLWGGKEMFKIVDSNKRFVENGWKDANLAISGRDSTKPQAVNEGRGGSNTRSGRGQPQRGSNQRGRANPNRGTGNIARTGRGGGRTSAAQDRNIWVHLVQYLRKKDLLPACIFVFSKKRCEENADSLSTQDFCTASEKSTIHMIIERSIARLKPEDRVLPQIRRLRDLLNRGIAVHHGGLLPIVKELVEILFAKTLVKVLFATETFAMGLNLPTRTVVFSGFRKHDGRAFRDLLPGEYTQMSGRAGRRGIDSVGTVIIVASNTDEAPPVARLKQMILGDPTKLRSQFRLTYNMMLNLLRVEALKIEEMIKRSFSENATQALLPEQEKQVKISEADLAKIKRAQCPICNIDIESTHAAAMAFSSASADLYLALLATPAGKRMFSVRRMVVFKLDGVRTIGVIMKEGVSRGPAPTVELLSLAAKNPTRGSSDLLPYLPRYRSMYTNLPMKFAEMDLKIIKVPIGDVEALLQHSVKVCGKYNTPLQYETYADCSRDVIQVHYGTLKSSEVLTDAQIPPDKLLRSRENQEAVRLAEEELAKMFRSWENPKWNELDWSRVKELQIRDVMEYRSRQSLGAQMGHCLECPEFLKHYAMCHDEWLIKENISQLRQLMSDQNLQLLPDYEQRIQVLKDLGFVDANSRVELKGKVACEIHSADELVLTELVLENVLAEFEPEEIVALLSAFVFQEKTDIEPTLTAHLEKGRDSIIAISEKVNGFQIQHQVILSSDDSNDFESKPRFGMVEVVYEWARGMSFNRITDLTDVLEGTIVRVITRLDETCREVKNAARIIGDPELFTKMQTAQELIKRDITAVASLYM